MDYARKSGSKRFFRQTRARVFLEIEGRAKGDRPSFHDRSGDTAYPPSACWIVCRVPRRLRATARWRVIPLPDFRLSCNASQKNLRNLFGQATRNRFPKGKRSPFLQSPKYSRSLTWLAVPTCLAIAAKHWRPFRGRIAGEGVEEAVSID